MSDEEMGWVKVRLKKDNPMVLKRELARRIVTELYDGRQASEAEEHFERMVVEKAPLEGDVVEARVGGSVVTGERLGELIVDKGLVKSKSEVRRLIDQGAVYVGEKKLVGQEIGVGDGVMVRVGRRKYLKLKQ